MILARGADGIRKGRLPTKSDQRYHCANLFNFWCAFYNPMYLIHHYITTLLQNEEA